MARKRLTFFTAVHAILNGRRWLRFWGIFLAGCIFTLLTATASTPLSANVWTDPAILVRQGQHHFESGEYTEAVSSLEKAIVSFSEQNQPLQQAITLSNLALVHQSLRQWEDGETALEQGLALLGVSPEDIATDTLPDLDVERLRIFAAVLNVYAKGQLLKGNPTQALAVWQQIYQAYIAVGDTEGQISNQINQLQAFQSLGLHRQATELTKELTDDTFPDLPASLMKIKGLRSFGDTLRNIGELNDSQLMLEKAQRTLEKLNDTQQLAMTDWERNQELSAILLSLGNTNRALANREKERRIVIDRQGVLPWQCLSLKESFPEKTSKIYAIEPYKNAEDFYLKAENIFPTNTPRPPANMTRLSAQLNRLSILLDRELVGSNTQDLWETTYAELKTLPSSRATIYAQINLAKQGSCLNQLVNDKTENWDDIINLLADAIENSNRLDEDDIPTRSYALGSLGSLYELLNWLETEKTQQAKSTVDNLWLKKAQTLTEQALLLAQPSEYPDIAYQWQWQLARIKKAQGFIQETTDLYLQTVKTLEAIRENLLTINSDVQFSFRDNVEPVYRETAALLLKDPVPSEENLKEAINLIDTLQLAELENFLRCNLTGTFELSKAEVKDSSAIFYTIILTDRLEVIVQLPDQKLEHHRIYKPGKEFISKLDRLRDKLQGTALSDEADELSLEVYQWLMPPQIEETLDSYDINSLVFVLDGNLRNIPIAALQTEPYNPEIEGPKYLIEKYAVALAPRLQIQNPQAINLSNSRALFFGLSEIPKKFQSDFSPLPGVQNEALNLNSQLPSQLILNKDFTDTTLEQEIQRTPFSILHFATHGEFSSEPENTYLLAWNSRIKSNDLRDILQQRRLRDSIELLVLSACKTADGDNRATLGIAGLSLQAGAESTVASLWTVDDKATVQLMDAFYQALINSPNPISRTEALRQAQLTMLQNESYKIPTYWAPFILIGNWL